jgi:hypothetical protein
MQWWNDLIDWLGTDAGWRIVSGAIVPFVAIVIAGVIAAAVARSGTGRVIAQQNREYASAAVASMIHAGRMATRWSLLPSGQRERADAEFIAADVQLRLLPLTGSGAAADWATHELGSMRRDSASFSFQAEQTYVEFRDRLLEWQRHPNRARRLFALDLERFNIEEQGADAALVEQQRRWAAEEAAAAASASEPVKDEEPAPVRAVPFASTAASETLTELPPEPAPVPTPEAPMEIEEAPTPAAWSLNEPLAAPLVVNAPPAPEPLIEPGRPAEPTRADEPVAARSQDSSESAPAQTTPFVFTRPGYTQPAAEPRPEPLVEPETPAAETPADEATPPTGPIERRPIERFDE